MIRGGRRLGTALSGAFVIAVVLGHTVAVGAAPGGKRLWVAPDQRIDKTAIAVSPDGSRVFVTGRKRVYGGEAYDTLAEDASTGRKLWETKYQVHRFALDSAYAIAVSPDGSTVFVTGQSTDTPNVYDYATVAYDSVTGAQRWVTRFDDPNHGSDTPASIAVSPLGDLVFVTGVADLFSDHGYGETIAYSTSTGTPQWAAAIHGTSYAEGSSVLASPDGTRVYVTGSRDGTALSVAYDAHDGATLWRSEYAGSSGGDSAQSATLEADGSALFVADAGCVDAGCDYVTIAYDTSTGTRRWVRRYDDPSHGDDRARAIEVSPDGQRVFVTGSDENLGGIRAATIAYDATTGARLWSRFQAAGAYPIQATAIAVVPDRDAVIVTGDATAPGTGDDYLLVAYDAHSGARLWLSQYDDRRHAIDVPRGLAIDASRSSVIVTGMPSTVAYKI